MGMIFIICIVLWNMLLRAEVLEGKKSGRIRKISKCKSIAHRHCRYYLAKCFIFLNKKTMDDLTQSSKTKIILNHVDMQD